MTFISNNTQFMSMPLIRAPHLRILRSPLVKKKFAKKYPERLGSLYTDEKIEIYGKVACSVGVLLVRANAKSLRSFVRPAMFDLQLEWTVGVEGGGGEKDLISSLHSPTPTPLLIFDRQPPPWHKFIPFPSLPLPLKSKMAAIIFVMKLLGTRLPKLRLLCRLFEKRN